MAVILHTLDFSYAGLQISFHEEWNKLLLNGRSIPLTPTEYKLCMTFFHEWFKTNDNPVITKDGLAILVYLNATDLQERIRLASKQLLRKHISNINGKLAPFSLHIKGLDRGYLFIFAPEER